MGDKHHWLSAGDARRILGSPRAPRNAGGPNERIRAKARHIIPGKARTLPDSPGAGRSGPRGLRRTIPVGLRTTLGRTDPPVDAGDGPPVEAASRDGIFRWSGRGLGPPPAGRPTGFPSWR